MCTILDEGKEIVKSGRRKSIDREWSVVDKVPLYDFIWPLGGMFIWIHMNFESHPLWKKTTAEKLARALWIHLTTPKYRVLVAPGGIFAPTEAIREEKSWAYFRMCFAAVDEPDLDKTSRQFVAGVQDFWRKKSLDDIEEMDLRGTHSSESLADLKGGC